jgi:hypothetical protein
VFKLSHTKSTKNSEESYDPENNPTAIPDILPTELKKAKILQSLKWAFHLIKWHVSM